MVLYCQHLDEIQDVPTATLEIWNQGSAYRMVSDEATFLLDAMSPVDFIAAERDLIKVRVYQNPVLGHHPL